MEIANAVDLVQDEHDRPKSSVSKSLLKVPLVHSSIGHRAVILKLSWQIRRALKPSEPAIRHHSLFSWRRRSFRWLYPLLLRSSQRVILTDWCSAFRFARREGGCTSRCLSLLSHCRSLTHDAASHLGRLLDCEHQRKKAQCRLGLRG